MSHSVFFSQNSYFHFGIISLSESPNTFTSKFCQYSHFNSKYSHFQFHGNTVDRTQHRQDKHSLQGCVSGCTNCRRSSLAQHPDLLLCQDRQRTCWYVTVKFNLLVCVYFFKSCRLCMKYVCPPPMNAATASRFAADLRS